MVVAKGCRRVCGADAPVWVSRCGAQGGDQGAIISPDLGRADDRDRILTNVMLYWLTGTGVRGKIYYEDKHAGGWPQPSGIPTGLPCSPRTFRFAHYAERSNNIVHWSEFDRGGHFAAMEAPDLFVSEVRKFFRRFR